MEDEDDYEYCLEVIDYNLRDNNISLIKTDYELEVIPNDKKSGGKQCEFVDIYETENKNKGAKTKKNDANKLKSTNQRKVQNSKKSALDKVVKQLRASSKNDKNKSTSKALLRSTRSGKINKVSDKNKVLRKSSRFRNDNDVGNKMEMAEREGDDKNVSLEKCKKRKGNNKSDLNEDLKEKSEENDNVQVRNKSGDSHLTRVQTGSPKISKFNTKRADLTKKRVGKNVQKKVEKIIDKAESEKSSILKNVVKNPTIKNHDKSEESFKNKVFGLKPILKDDDLICFTFDNDLYKRAYVCTKCDYSDFDKVRFNLHSLKCQIKVFDDYGQKTGTNFENDQNKRNVAKKNLHKTNEEQNNKTDKNKKSVDILCCNQCDYFTGDQINLFLHIKGHIAERIFNCNHCDGKFVEEGLLKEHVKRCHTETMYCPVCDYSTEIRTKLIQHVVSHKGDSKFGSNSIVVCM